MFLFLFAWPLSGIAKQSRRMHQLGAQAAPCRARLIFCWTRKCRQGKWRYFGETSCIVFFISLSTYPIVIGTEEGGRPACAAYQRWRIQSPVPLYIGIGCGVLVYSLHCSCNLNAAGRAALIRLISLASEYVKPHFLCTRVNKERGHV